MTDETRQDPPALTGAATLPEQTAVPGEQLPDLPETAYGPDAVDLPPAEGYAIPEGTDDPDGDVGGPADSAIDLSYLQAEHDQDGGDEAAQTDEVTP